MQEQIKEKYGFGNLERNMTMIVRMKMTMIPFLSYLPQLGTFNIWQELQCGIVCPSLFYQWYTIHVEVYGQIVPLVYSLLP